MEKIFLVFCILILNAPVLFAEIGSTDQIDLSQIEAAEREIITKELTYRLDTKFTCTQTLNWDDGGSGADLDGYFYIPSVNQSEYIIGGFATQKKKSSNSCILTVSETPNNPENTPALLVPPIDWKQVWIDKGSGARKDGSLWEAIPLDSNYKCLGNMSQLGHDQKPNIPNYRCVHSSLTEKVITNNIIWSDKGSGADNEVTVLRLPNTATFITIPARIGKVEAFDLKADASGIPDPALVEEKLAMKMEKIQRELETTMKPKMEQKERAEKVERKQEAEQKRLAERKQPSSIDTVENIAAFTSTSTKDETSSSSPTSPTVSENQKSDGGYFTMLARSVTGWIGSPRKSTTSGSTTATIGVRGLGAEELQTAHPDINALQKMDSYVANASDAAGFANKAQLVAQNVDYLEPESTDKSSPDSNATIPY